MQEVESSPLISIGESEKVADPVTEEEEVGALLEVVDPSPKGRLSQRARRRSMAERALSFSSKTKVYNMDPSKRRGKLEVKKSRTGKIKKKEGTLEVRKRATGKSSLSKKNNKVEKVKNGEEGNTFKIRPKKRKSSASSLKLPPFFDRDQGSGWRDHLKKADNSEGGNRGSEDTVIDGICRLRGDHILVEGVGKGNGKKGED